MDQLVDHSFTYRIAISPPQGRKVLTQRLLPAEDPRQSGE